MDKELDIFDTLRAFQKSSLDVAAAIAQLKNRRILNDNVDLKPGAGKDPNFHKLDGAHLDILAKLDGTAFNAVALSEAYFEAFKAKIIK